MFSLIIALIFFIIFIILSVVGGNYFLRNVLESLIGEKKETFRNIDDELDKLGKIDECKSTDWKNYNQLNFQTATNIPLSPNKYKNHIGSFYINKNVNEQSNYFDNDGLTDGKYCMSKPRLLYDGIWDANVKIEAPFEEENWKLTNGNLSGGSYCSDKMIEVNKPIPKDFKDKSAVWVNDNGGYYYTYFNDVNDDVFDTEVVCFPQVFDAGMNTANSDESLKKFL
jgi:hypothetical protein